MRQHGMMLMGMLVVLALVGCGRRNSAAETTAGELQTAAGEDIIVNEPDTAPPMETQSAPETQTADGGEREPAQENKTASAQDSPEGETENVLLPAGLDNMLAAMDGLLMCTIENNYRYDEDDDLFFWSAIFYTAGNYPALFGDTQMTPDGLIVPADTVQYYAWALFDGARNVNEVPIPQELSGIISYDAQESSYLFATGDRGLSYAKIERVEESEDKLMAEVVTGLYDAETNTRYAAAKFKLRLKLDAISEKDTVFGYSVCQMKLLAEDEGIF